MTQGTSNIVASLQAIQDQICTALETLDGTGRFHEDRWERPGGGGGRTRVMSEGSLIEKGGVNFSHVYGEAPEKMLQALKLKPAHFMATGVSIVLHPNNPWVPIIHMNVRYFEMSSGVWWFGGGIDLTPHYIFKEDAAVFHQQLQRICNTYHPEYYPRFKTWADNYFYLKHRQETRGVGGIFFDRLGPEQEIGKNGLWNFVRDVANGFVPIYTKVAEKYRGHPVEPKQKEWQLLRRGRYVEFNLVWDKGTKFGLDTEGRTESILMSLPAQAAWHYDHRPAPDSLEAETLSLLKKNINWLEYASD